MNHCDACGAEALDDDLFCAKCGAAIETYDEPANAEAHPASGTRPTDAGPASEARGVELQRRLDEAIHEFAEGNISAETLGRIETELAAKITRARSSADGQQTASTKADPSAGVDSASQPTERTEGPASITSPPGAGEPIPPGPSGDWNIVGADAARARHDDSAHRQPEPSSEQILSAFPPPPPTDAHPHAGVLPSPQPRRPRLMVFAAAIVAAIAIIAIAVVTTGNDDGPAAGTREDSSGGGHTIEFTRWLVGIYGGCTHVWIDGGPSTLSSVQLTMSNEYGTRIGAAQAKWTSRTEGRECEVRYRFDDLPDAAIYELSFQDSPATAIRTFEQLEAADWDWDAAGQ